MLKEFAQYLQSLKDNKIYNINGETYSCLLYTSPSPRDCS